MALLLNFRRIRNGCWTAADDDADHFPLTAAVFGFRLALAGWLTLEMAACLGRRWPVGAWMLTAWGLGGFALFAVSGRVEYYVEGLTQAVAMLALFVLLIVPAWILSLAGWDGRY